MRRGYLGLAIAFSGIFLAGSVQASIYYNDYPSGQQSGQQYRQQSYQYQTSITTTTKFYKTKKKYNSDYSKRDYSYPSKVPATGKPVFIYSPAKLTWAAYDREGNLVRTGPGSGGQGYCSDVGRSCRTPTGVYSIYNKAGPGYRSSKYPIETGGGAPMPWAMFFNGGFAIHGASNVPEYNASHGCIRVHPEDARWLSTSFLTTGSTVIVRPYY